MSDRPAGSAQAAEPSVQPPRYRRDSPSGYCLGSFPVLELLRHRPEAVRDVVIASGLDRSRREPIEELCHRHGVRPRQDDGLLRRLAHRSDIDAFALFDKFRDSLDPAADHLVLVAPGNPGNLGTIMRTAAAFGVRDLATVEPAVDSFSPHVVRASIGARFQLRVEPFASLDEYRERFPRPLHLFSGEGAVPLGESRLTSPFAVVFGPEWPGLPPALLAAGTVVSIPHDPTVESLNLAVAVGIALYVARNGPRS